jgi:hypothetical protein
MRGKTKIPLWGLGVLILIVFVGISIVDYFLLGGKIFDFTQITTADIVLILVSLVALFGWWFRRKVEDPDLGASYDHKEPMARRSARSTKNGR